jgi:protein phosphatase
VAAPLKTIGARGIQIEWGQASDPGLDPAKRVNEDSCGYAETPFGHLFVVCDGMGGHSGGKQASDIAIRTIFDHVTHSEQQRLPRDVLIEAIEEAARRVYQFGGPPANQQRPGSTCVSLLLHDGKLDVAHVGDSRAYAIRGKQIYRLTRDHSMVQELLDGGVISEQEAIGHPDSNKITRALGMTPEVEVELRQDPMELYDGDIFILATDGLTDLARNDDILLTITEYLKKQDVQTACNELVALANRRGGHDNITVQVVRVVRAGPRSSPTLAQVPAEVVPSSRRISTTIDGTPPAPGPTVVQEPTLDQAPVVGPAYEAYPAPVVGPTAVDPPAPTIIDVPEPPPAELPQEEEEQASTLVYLILAMAAVIGLLLALLLWSLYFR